MEKANPLVSIIIPVYNGGNYLKDAIESALSQSYKNIEVIVVNDGSNDGGVVEKIALSYGDKIRYLKKENGGVASALNTGIKSMNGEYFSWLSHDDIYYPNKIEASIAALIHDGDMYKPVYSKCDFVVMEDGKDAPVYDLSPYPVDLIYNGLFAVMQNLINGCTVLLHKNYFKVIGLFNEELQTTQDYDMWFRVFRGKRVIYIDDALVMSRLHAEQGSMTIASHKKNCEHMHLKFMDQITDKEIHELYGNKYSFYFNRLEFFEEYGFEDAVRLLELKIKAMREPLENVRLQKKFGDSINPQGKKICVYCAGNNGNILLKKLRRRGIGVDCFSDSDESKWNLDINGCKCIPLSDLNVDDYLFIISKSKPEDVQNLLVCKGVKQMLTFDRLKREIFMTPGKV